MVQSGTKNANITRLPLVLEQAQPAAGRIPGASSLLLWHEQGRQTTALPPACWSAAALGLHAAQVPLEACVPLPGSCQDAGPDHLHVQVSKHYKGGCCACNALGWLACGTDRMHVSVVCHCTAGVYHSLPEFCHSLPGSVTHCQSSAMHCQGSATHCRVQKSVVWHDKRSACMSEHIRSTAVSSLIRCHQLHLT